MLMDFKDPGKRYVVGDWVEDAVKIVSYVELVLTRCAADDEPMLRLSKCTSARKYLS